MRELNNLLGATLGLPSDKEIFNTYGRCIADFKSDGINNNILWDYVKGMVMMSMHDLNYTDGEIEHVLTKINAHYWVDKESDVLIWTHTHILDDDDYIRMRERDIIER